MVKHIYISTARTNSSVMVKHIYIYRLQYLFLAAVIVMEVVGIDKIKIFRNFIFENRPLFLPAISIFAYFFWFWHEQKIKKNKICVMYNTSMDGPPGKLSIAGLRSKKIAQQVPRLKCRCDAGLCSILPVYRCIVGTWIPAHCAVWRTFVPNVL
jgi:hypothetical protein